MKKNKNLILVELNELNFDIVKLYSQKYKLKFFNKNFFNKIFNTFSEKKYENLEPWIQWVSAHTGMLAEEHKIFRLGDSKKQLKYSQIFEEVEGLGFAVGAISPMNAINKMKNPDYFISDPWTDGGSDKNFLHNFLAKTISRVVNSNSEGKVLFRDYLVLFISIFKYSSFQNYLKYIYYFFKGIKKKWNKAIFLDFLLNNIHLKLLKKNKTNFSCIFFNAGAHIQHHYFFNSEFNNSNLKNPSWYIAEKDDPIKDVIFFYDEILFEYSKIENYEFIIATGLSQRPYDRKKFYYRIKDHALFLNQCEIVYKKILPRMTRDFVIEFETENDCVIAFNKFEKINILNNEKIFFLDNRGKSLFLTFLISREIGNKDYLLIDKSKKLELINFISFVALKNGMHSEKGYLYCSNRYFQLVNNNLSHIKDLKNIILNFFKN